MAKTILQTISERADQTWGKEDKFSRERLAHWFNTAWTWKDELFKEGLWETATLVEDHIHEQQKFCYRRERAL